jgi:hypothetical protein
MLLGPRLSLPAAELSITNLPAFSTNAAPAKHKLTAAERRERIEAWRKERGNWNPTNASAFPPVDTRKLPPEERKALIRAQLAEIQQRKAISNSPPVGVPTNAPAN